MSQPKVDTKSQKTSSIIQIDGWNHSGKGILKGLLDGHPSIFVTPCHDAIQYMCGTNWEGAAWLTNRDFFELRRRLSLNTRYYRWEEVSMNGGYHEIFGVDCKPWIPCNLNFHALDQSIATEIMQLKTWNPSEIISTIYRNIQQQIMVSDSLFKPFYATLADPLLPYLTRFKNTFQDGKIIYLERPTEAILATRFSLLARGKTNTVRRRLFDDIINGTLITRITQYRNQFNKLRAHYPADLLTISFEDLILDTENVMKQISKFLSIPYDPILRIFSTCGKPQHHITELALGKELDSVHTLLTKNELYRLVREINMIQNQLASNTQFSSPLVKHYYTARRYIRRKWYRITGVFTGRSRDSHNTVKEQSQEPSE